MNELTLRELCQECGVSRRAIQGYEMHGLVKATGKTDRGYLLYGQAEKVKVEHIKSLQNYGFTVKEILSYQTADIAVQRNILKDKLEALRLQKHKLEAYIAEIQEMLEHS